MRVRCEAYEALQSAINGGDPLKRAGHKINAGRSALAQHRGEHIYRLPDKIAGHRVSFGSSAMPGTGENTTAG